MTHLNRRERARFKAMRHEVDKHERRTSRRLESEMIERCKRAGIIVSFTSEANAPALDVHTALATIIVSRKHDFDPAAFGRAVDDIAAHHNH